MYYRCPVCNGKGLVEPNFGGPGTSKQCPGCDGTGMQWISESQPVPFNPCPPRKIKPYIPWDNPFAPSPPWDINPMNPFKKKKRRGPSDFPPWRKFYG